MYRHSGLSAPFFEIGPKQYLYGDALMDLAQMAERASVDYGVPIVFDPPLVHLEAVVSATSSLFVFAQHIDCIEPGRGMGAVLPEAVKAAGASGVMLNHAEWPLSLSQISGAIRRADEVGLASIVCADSIAEAAALAHLEPNVVVAEPTDLIGSGTTSDADYVQQSIEAVKAVNSQILVLQGAGIKSGADVYDVIRAGAHATGSSSAVATAADPESLIREMVQAIKQAWDERSATSQKP
jgi:triosephosphate isomerase